MADTDGRHGDRSTTISGPVIAGGGSLDRVGTIGHISGGTIAISSGSVEVSNASEVGGGEDIVQVNLQMLQTLQKIEFQLSTITNLKL